MVCLSMPSDPLNRRIRYTNKICYQISERRNKATVIFSRAPSFKALVLK